MIVSVFTLRSVYDMMLKIPIFFLFTASCKFPQIPFLLLNSRNTRYLPWCTTTSAKPRKRYLSIAGCRRPMGPVGPFVTPAHQRNAGSAPRVDLVHYSVVGKVMGVAITRTHWPVFDFSDKLCQAHLPLSQREGRITPNRDSACQPVRETGVYENLRKTMDGIMFAVQLNTRVRSVRSFCCFALNRWEPHF